jgi:hypothetical protein
MESVEEGFERPTAASRRSLLNLDAGDVAQGVDGAAQVCRQRVERSGGQIVASSPRVRSVDPFEDRPAVREYVARLPEVADHRGLHDRPERGPLDPLHDGHLLVEPGRCVWASRKSNDDVRLVIEPYPPEGVVGTRRSQIIDRTL